MKTETNFVNDLRDHIAADLTAAGYRLIRDGKPTNDPHDLLLMFWNARARRIAARPRTVQWSRELRARLGSLPSNIAAGVSAVEAEFLAGADITPRLSRRLKKHYNDPMLNDWGIHHLHLGTVVESDGFVERDDDVLFVMVRDETVYFLDVRPHGAWEDEDLVEMVHGQWPNSITQFRIKGMRLENSQMARQERRTLRTGGVYAPFQTNDGTIYGLLGGGYATTGDNIMAVVWGDKTLKTVRRIEEQFASRSDQWAALVAERIGAPPSDLILRLVTKTSKFEITGYAVRIENTTPHLEIPVQVV